MDGEFHSHIPFFHSNTTYSVPIPLFQLGAHGMQSVHPWDRVCGASLAEWGHIGLCLRNPVGCKGEEGAPQDGSIG